MTDIEPAHRDADVIEDGARNTTYDGIANDTNVTHPKDLFLGSVGVDIGFVDVVGEQRRDCNQFSRACAYSNLSDMAPNQRLKQTH